MWPKLEWNAFQRPRIGEKMLSFFFEKPCWSFKKKNNYTGYAVSELKGLGDVSFYRHGNCNSHLESDWHCNAGFSICCESRWIETGETSLGKDEAKVMSDKQVDWEQELCISLEIMQRQNCWRYSKMEEETKRQSGFTFPAGILQTTSIQTDYVSRIYVNEHMHIVKLTSLYVCRLSIWQKFWQLA